MRSALITLVIASLCPFILFAESSRWKFVGPETGKYMFQLYPDLQHPNIWYTINDSKVFRSVDGARSWIPTQITADQLFVHPATSRVLAVKSTYYEKSTFYESIDFGKSFHTISTVKAWHYAAVSPVQENVVGILNQSIDPQFFLSTNGGTNWSDLTKNLALTKGYNYNGCIVYDSALEDIAFSGTSASAIYISVGFVSTGAGCGPQREAIIVTHDLGKTWSVLSEFAYYVQIYEDANFPDRIFVGSGSGTFQLTDVGAVQLTSRSIYRISSFPENRNHLLSIWNQRTLESFDSGITWTERDPVFPRGAYAFYAMKNPEGSSLVLTGGGIYRRSPTSDWVASNKGLRNSAPIQALAASGNTVYAGVQGFFYRSDDQGNSWKDLSFHLPPRSSVEVAVVDPTNPRYLLAIMDENRHRSLFVTRDGGSQWKKLMGAQTSGYGMPIVFSPDDPSVVYLALRSGVYRSVDKGLHFARISEIPASGLTLIPSSPGTIIIHNCYSIWKSEDSGRTFYQIDGGIVADDDGCEVEDVSAPSPDAPLLEIGGTGSLFRSTRGGDLWRSWSSVKYFGNSHGEAWGGQRIYPADRIGSHLYLVNNAWFMESRDSGKSWMRLDQELLPDFDYARRFIQMTDPQAHPFYVSTYSGVFRHE